MWLRDLPDDILHLVFKVSFMPRRDIVPVLKSNLPLLAVCRRWRRLALATIHSGVDIRYGSEPSYDSNPGDAPPHANDTGDKPDGSKITTNLDLVVSAGCVQAVKQVKITAYYTKNPLPSLGAAIRLMRTAAEKWSGVVQLEILVYAGGILPAPGINVADHEDEIKQTSAVLAATMPGIRHVFLGDRPPSPIARELNGQLAVLFSDQLQTLYSQNPINVPQDHTFRQLRHVTIYHDRDINYQYPCMDPTMLVSLDFTWWPSDHSWAPFSTDNNPGVIEFPNLKMLSAAYIPPTNIGDAGAQRRDGRPWKLHFPKLSTLDVRCDQDRCPLLEYAVLPPRMDKISIEATAPVLARVAEAGLPTTRRLMIEITNTSNGDPAALAAVSRIFGNPRKSRARILRIEDYLLSVLPESITCTSLTVLSISVDISVDTMLGLARKLPMLITLDTKSLTLGNIQEDISVPGPEEGCLVAPLGSKIRWIYIDAKCNEPEPEILVSVAKYLLLRIPTLARFCSFEIPGSLMTEFVKAYSNRYPHLARVNYKLGSRVN